MASRADSGAARSVDMSLAASTGVPDLKALYDGHRWFALRDALDRTAPAFYRGAVACGLNDRPGL